MNIRLKRVYEAAVAEDGRRVLVDRLWPRGLSKDKAKVDVWLKDIAPSTELRTWFGHDPAKWTEFNTRYLAELADRSAAVSELRQYIAAGPVTLLYGAKDEQHNHAFVLKEYLLSKEMGEGSV